MIKKIKNNLNPFLDHSQGFFWYTLNHLASVSSTLIIAYLFANFLGKNEYGIYKYIMSIVAILGIFTVPGLNQIYGKNVVENKEGKIFNVIKIKTLSGLVGSFICVVIGLYYIINENSTLGYSFIIASIFLPLVEPLSASDYYFLGKNKQKTLAKINSGSSLLSIILILILILQTKSIILLSLSYFITSVFPAILSFIFAKREINKNNMPLIKLENSEVTRSFKITLSGVIPIISQYIDKIIVFQILGPATLAVYNIAIAIPDQIKSYFKNAQSIFFKKTIESIDDNFFNKYTKRLLFPAIALFAIILFYIIISPLIFRIMFPLYKEAIFYSALYSISIISVLSVIPLNVFTVNKSTKTLNKFNLTRSIFQIITMSVFTYFGGLTGLIIARIISEIFTLSISILFLKDKLEH